MSARHWLFVSSSFLLLVAVACVCSYSLTRTGDEFAGWLSTALVVLGVAFTGVVALVDPEQGWSGRRYGAAFLILLVPVTLASRHATPIVGASVIGSRCALQAALLARLVWRALRR